MKFAKSGDMQTAGQVSALLSLLLISFTGNNNAIILIDLDAASLRVRQQMTYLGLQIIVKISTSTKRAKPVRKRR